MGQNLPLGESLHQTPVNKSIFFSRLPPSVQVVPISLGGTDTNRSKNGIEIHLIIFYYLYDVEYRILLGGIVWVGLTTDKERQHK